MRPVRSSIFRRGSLTVAMVAMLTLAAGATLGASAASGAVLNVTLAGSGTGTVTSNPVGIACSNIPDTDQTTCSFDFGFALGGVQLRATSPQGSAFVGWSGTAGGTCSGSAPICQTAAIIGLPLDATATFAPTPDAPGVATGSASQIDFPTARLAGMVNPNSDLFTTSRCYFEYGPTTDYGRRADCHPGTVGPGNADEEVTATTGMLRPDTVYHYRLVAENGGGTTRGADQTFRSDVAPHDACPNADVRAQQGLAAQVLPRCMAFEMVSPQQTGGQRVVIPASTPDGNQLLIASPGGFPGTENLPKLGSYALATRTEAGWTATPLDPPASQYPFLSIASMIDYSEDLTRSLWFVNKAEDKGTNRYTLVVREPDGSVVDASPTLDDAFTPWAAGGSSDLSTLIIASLARPDLTDGTVDARATNRTSLVAVRRQTDGSFETEQVAFRDGATMGQACEAQLGGSNATSSRNAVSADGSRIFFTFTGSLTCNNATNQRVWAKVDDAEPIELSASHCTIDCGAAARALYEGASRDGSRVYFTTEQKLVDGDQDTSLRNDIYEYDFNASESKLIPVTASTSAVGAGALRVTRVSPDGTHAYFVANGRPLAGENARGQTPQSGNLNFYVYKREKDEPAGEIQFIGALDPVADINQSQSDVGRNAQTSTDGRFLLFTSAADLTAERLPGDSYKDLYRYDAQTDDLRRIWSDDRANNGSARTAQAFLDQGFGSNPDGARSKNSTLSRQISDDGATVGFTTAEPLSPHDTNGKADAYMWQAETGLITLLSGGESPGASGFSGMTPSGDSVYFRTSEPMVSTHTSGAVAGYVARVGGGFLDSLPSPVPCSGDACQGSPGSPPASSAAGSSALTGDGNASPETRERLSVGKLSRKDLRRAAHSGVLPIRVRTSRAGVLRIVARAKIGNRVQRVAGRTLRSQKAGAVTVRLRLNRAAKLQLRSGRALRVTLRVASPGAQVRTATVHLKRGRS